MCVEQEEPKRAEIQTDLLEPLSNFVSSLSKTIVPTMAKAGLLPLGQPVSLSGTSSGKIAAP